MSDLKTVAALNISNFMEMLVKRYPGLCAYGCKRLSAPGLCCQWVHWTQKESNVWTGLSPPLMYRTYSNGGSLHRQLNHRPGRSSHTRLFRRGQEFLVLTIVYYIYNAVPRICNNEISEINSPLILWSLNYFRSIIMFGVFIHNT